MKNKLSLKIAGIICFLFTLFHLAFPWMPYWEENLAQMMPEYKAIFLTFHYIVVMYLAFMTVISLCFAKKLLQSPVKNVIMIMFSSLFLIRIVTEFMYWNISFIQTSIVLIMCIVPIVLFGLSMKTTLVENNKN